MEFITPVLVNHIVCPIQLSIYHKIGMGLRLPYDSADSLAFLDVMSSPASGVCFSKPNIRYSCQLKLIRNRPSPKNLDENHSTILFLSSSLGSVILLTCASLITSSSKSTMFRIGNLSKSMGRLFLLPLPVLFL